MSAAPPIRRGRSRRGCLGRLLVLALVLVVLGVPIGLAVLAALATDDLPVVSGRADLGTIELERAKALIAENDPRKLGDGEERTISLAQADLNLLANYGLGQVSRGGVVVVVAGGWLDLDASIALPANPFGRYANVSIGLRNGVTLPRFRSLRIGAIPVPGPIADRLLDRGLEWLYAESGMAGAEDVVRAVVLGEGDVRITYRWRTDIIETVRERLVTPDDEERLYAYHHHLVRIAHALDGKVSLAAVVEPMFALARSRSEYGDPVAENRAAIQVLAAYMDGRTVRRAVPGASQWPAPERLAVEVAGRVDLAQHFAVSAGIAVTGDSALARAIGLVKEVGDSRGGTGFSFRDLAADLAGTRFGQLATESERSARRLQALAGDSLAEAQLVPDSADLAERMTEAEFKERFGGVDGVEYGRVIFEIESRIDASPLYAR